MKKYMPWVVFAAVVAAVVWFLKNRAQTVSIMPVNSNTGTAGPFDSFSSLVSLIRGTGGPVNTSQPDRTGAIINAAGQVVKELPGLFSSIGSIFKSNQVPAVSSVPITWKQPSVSPSEDWSNMDGEYWGTSGFDAAASEAYSWN